MSKEDEFDVESADENISENDSDESSSAEEDEETAKEHVDSDASDGTSERCPICLLRLLGQEVATPESCDHVFCLECILEWSKKVTSCPMDRQVFENIFVREGHGCGKIVKTIPVSNTVEELDELLDHMDETCCEICGRSDREDRMLLCDGCDHGFHMECLDPPLDAVPIENWFCPGCDPEGILPASPRGDLSPRVIPRTREAERVRNRVQRRRTERTASPRPSTSRAKPTTRRSTKKRRKTTRKRKTAGKSEKNSGRKSSSSGKVGKRRKKKRRIERRIKAMLRRDHVKSVKERLAETLGLILPRREDPSNLIVPPPRLNRTEAPLSVQRSFAGIPSLSVFGSRDSIDYFSSGSDDESGGGELGLITRRPRMSRSAVASVMRQKRQLAPAPVRIEPPTQGPLDLLGSLLDTQSAFLAKNPSKDIEIRRDGTLVHKLPKPDRTGPPSVKPQERRTENPRIERERDGIDMSSAVREKKDNNGRIDVNSSSAPVKESHGGGRGGYDNAPPRGPSPNRNPAPQSFNFGRDWNVGSRGPLGFGPGRGHERPQGMNVRMPLDGDSPARPPFGRGRGRGDERPRKNSASDRDGEERPGLLDRSRESDLFDRRPAEGFDRRPNEPFDRRPNEPFDRRPNEPFDRRPNEPWSRRQESETDLWGRRDNGESSRQEPQNRPPRPDFLGGRPRFDGPGEHGRQDRRPDGSRPRFDEALGQRRPFGSEGPRPLFPDGPRSLLDRIEPPRHRLNGSELEIRPRPGNDVESRPRTDSEQNSSRHSDFESRPSKPPMEFEGRPQRSDSELEQRSGRDVERPLRPGPNLDLRPRLGGDFDMRPNRPGSDFDPRNARPGPDFGVRPLRPGADFDLRPNRPGSDFDLRPIRPGSDFDLRPIRPGSDFEPRNMRPGSEFEPRGIRPGGFEQRPMRPGLEFERPLRPAGLGFDGPHSGPARALFEPRVGGVLNRMPHGGPQNTEPQGSEPQGQRLLLPPRPDIGQRPGFSPRGPSPMQRPEMSPQRPSGPVNIPLSPQRPIRPPIRPQGLMDLVIERPPEESPSTSQSEFPRFLDPSKPPDVVNERPSFVGRPPFFERPPDLVQAPIVSYDDDNDETPAENQQEAQNYDGAEYQRNTAQSNFPPNAFQPQNFGQPPPFIGFPGGMPPPTMQSPYGLPLPALPVRYDTASQPDLIPQMPQFFNSNQSAPPLFPSAATIQAAENPRADYYDPAEALDDDVMDIPVPTQEAVDIPLPNVDIPLPEQDIIPLPVDTAVEPENEIPIPDSGIPMPEPKQSLDAERRSSLNAVASALSATTRRTGTIQINIKSQQAKQEELVNTISRLAKASLESIVAEMKSKEAEQNAEGRSSPEEGEEEKEKNEEEAGESPAHMTEEQEENASQSPNEAEESAAEPTAAPIDIFENPEENVPTSTETEEESRRRKVKENLSLLAVKETRKIESPIFDDEKERKEKAKRKKERQLAKEKSAAASPADTPAPAPTEEPAGAASDVTSERVPTPTPPAPKDQSEHPPELAPPTENERATPHSEDSWVEKSDERRHRGKSRERGKDRRGDRDRSRREKEREKERRSRRGRSRSPRKRDKRKKRSKEKRKERHKKREKKAESDISLSEPELEKVDASPVSSGEFPRPESQGSVENISDSSLNLVSDAEDGEIPPQPSDKPAAAEKPVAAASTRPPGDFEEGEISEESPERQRKTDFAGNSPDRRKVVELSPGRRKRLEAIAMAVSPDLRVRLEKGTVPPENVPEMHFSEKIAPQGDVTDVEWRKFTKKTRSYREVTLGSVNKEKEDSPPKLSPSPVRRQSRSKSRERVVQRESPSRIERTVSRVQPEAERAGRKESSERLVYRRSKSPQDNSRARRSVSHGKRRRSPSPRDRRGRSASKERRVERKRSPERKRRSVSRERKRSPERRRRSRSRKRSRDRSGRRKSVSKSPKRRKSRSVSRDKSPKRRKSRSPVKRGRSVDRTKRRRSKSPVRRRSKSKSLSPARREELVPRSRSRTPKKRRTSRSRKRRRSREKKRGNKRSPSLSGDSSSSSSKKEKRKKKRDDKKKTKKKTKEGEAAPRKEVVASGDNIRVSVNFGQNVQARPAIRGRQIVRGGKRRKIQMRPKVPPVMIDLIEGTETTLDSRPPEVVLIDSDGEKNVQEPLGPLDTEPLTDSPVDSPAQPEEEPAPELTEVVEKAPTPQPPVQQKIRIKIREEPARVEPNKDMFFDEEPVVAPSRGPVTPPEPSPKKDEYDPCDPTESPDNPEKQQDLYSPPASPAEAYPSPDLEPTVIPQEAVKEPSPPSPKKATPEIRTKSPESLKATAVVTPLPPSKPAQTVVQLQKPDLSQPPPTMQPQGLLPPAIGSMVPRSFVPHQLLAAAVMAQAQQQVQVPVQRPPGILLPHQPVPPHLLFNLPALQRPEAPNFFGPPPILQQPPVAQLHEGAVVGGSPKSPDSSELSDLFEPPVETKKPRKGPKSPPPPSASKAKPSALKKKPTAPMQVDDVPSSAMELQALIKLTRQEQIVEQVKMVLKPHYRKKKINKEEYKDIMKRAVGKITHSRASSINPAKVEALVTGYVKKIIHERKKA